MVAWIRVFLLAGLGLAAAGPSAWAQCAGNACLSPSVELRGTFDFFATGGSFTFSDDDDDRPDGLLMEGTVEVPMEAIPPRADLVQALLYFGGSLYADGDGVDAPDTTVDLQRPDAEAFDPVVAEHVFRSGPIEGFPEVSLYTARADVTSLLSEGPLTGTYRVRGFDADIFDGEQEHTAANASFSLVLIYRESRLPPRSIVLFDGMETVLGSTVTLDLSGFVVSRFPSGSLTFYALEGDCNPGPDACGMGNNQSGLERIRVLGVDRELVLSDPNNPPNDIFNRTINTVQPPLRDVVGTDIDAFDISQVLRPGDEAVTVEVTAPRPRGGNSGELVGLAYVVVGIDVFAPELSVDSRIELSNELGTADVFFPGDPLRVTFALSNTGNLAAEDVQLTARLPDEVTDFLVLPDSPGRPDGRAVTAEGLQVREGEVQSIELLVETVCPLPAGGTLALTATVGADGVPPFTLTTTAALEGRDRCGPRFFLFGGGGCSGGSAPDAFVWLVGSAWAWRAVRGRRRRSRHGALALVAAAWASSVACGGEPVLLDRAAPLPAGTVCPGRSDMVVIPSVRGEAPYCIDTYEARAVGGELGDPVQPSGGNGTTTALAVSERFRRPTTGLTWFQADAACRNSGKRLCSAAEWQLACGGTLDSTYPYGDTYEPGRCNGFSAARGALVETGAMIVAQVDGSERRVASGCVSVYGVYDLSGNLSEWNADSFLDGRRRGRAGGSFQSNAQGLRCITEDVATNPEDSSETAGFRCCFDLF